MKIKGFKPIPVVAFREQQGWKEKRGNCPGCGFARPEIANSTYAKTFYPHGLRPWDGEWEEPAWHHARFAIVMPCREKAAGLRPAPRRGRKAPDPISFGTSHTRYDTNWRHPSYPKTSWAVTKRESMGAIRPQTPNQEQCPWTRSVWRGACWTPRDLGSYDIFFLGIPFNRS